MARTPARSGGGGPLLLTMAGLLATLTGPGVVIAAAALQFVAAAPGYEARLRQLLAEATAWLDARNVDLTWLAGLADPAPLFNLMAATFTGLVTTLSGAVLVVLIAGFMLLDAASYLERQAGRLATRSSPQKGDGSPTSSVACLRRPGSRRARRPASGRMDDETW
jgi:predicted PurR-regulated permease PerM